VAQSTEGSESVGLLTPSAASGTGHVARAHLDCAAVVFWTTNFRPEAGIAALAALVELTIG